MPAESAAVPVEVRRVAPDQVRPLRHRVLRACQPFSTVSVPSDELPGVVHFAAYEGEVVVGVMTMFPDRAPGGDPGALRIRWMAVEPDRQGQGIGAALLDAGFSLAGERGVTTVWAHARDTALAFYLRHGFEAVSSSFVDPDTGLPHTTVIRQGLGGG